LVCVCACVFLCAGCVCVCVHVSALCFAAMCAFKLLIVACCCVFPLCGAAFGDRQWMREAGMPRIHALGANSRHVTAIDARDAGVNRTLSAVVWRALADGLASGRTHRTAVAYVPSTRGWPRVGAVSGSNPLATVIAPTDVLLLALPGRSRTFALQLHADVVRSCFLLLTSALETASLLEGMTLWDWELDPGPWPSGVAALCRAANLRDRRRNLQSEPSFVQSLRITFVSVTGDGAEFRHNLGASRVYQERASSRHRWLLYPNTGGEPLASFLGKLQTQAEVEHGTELILFLHADLFLPESFEAELFSALRYLYRVDPHWALAGFFGVPLDWEPDLPDEPWRVPRVVGRGRDFFNSRYVMPGNLTPVQCVDETALLLRSRFDAEPSPSFDPALPSTSRIWLGGTDTVLEGLAQGRRSYALGVHVDHAMWDREGNDVSLPERRQECIRKYTSHESTAVHAAAMEFMSRKFLRSPYPRLGSRNKVFAQNCGFDARSWRNEFANVEGDIV